MGLWGQFTGRQEKSEPVAEQRVVKPAGKITWQVPGLRPSIHCIEADWDLAGMAGQDIRAADSERKAGMSRGRCGDSGRPRRSGERP